MEKELKNVKKEFKNSTLGQPAIYNKIVALEEIIDEQDGLYDTFKKTIEIPDKLSFRIDLNSQEIINSIKVIPNRSLKVENIVN